MSIDIGIRKRGRGAVSTREVSGDETGVLEGAIMGRSTTSGLALFAEEATEGGGKIEVLAGSVGSS